MILLPDRLTVKEYIIKELRQYWPKHTEIVHLPVPVLPWPEQEPLPPIMKSVILPEWARDIGVDGCILVPFQFIQDYGNTALAWKNTDWFSTMFWYLNCFPERVYEKKHGVIHSYSYRLKGWDERIWDYAWVNRIALFLRRWAAVRANKNETELFGPLPEPHILLTHDLDAIHKTFSIRLKQSIFLFFNALRLMFNKQLKAAVLKTTHAMKFFFVQVISID